MKMKGKQTMLEQKKKIYKNFEDNIKAVEDYIECIGRYFIATFKSNEFCASASKTLCKTKYLEEIPEKYNIIYKELVDTLEELEAESEKLDSPIDITYEDLFEEPAYGDILSYICTEIKDGVSDRETLYENTYSIVEAYCITKGDLEYGERFHDMYDNPQKVYGLVDKALILNEYEYATRIKSQIMYVEETLRGLELFNEKQLLNIYRQCFIQIMAFFDSCTFDLMRTFMNKDFFIWLKEFENTSLKTHDIAKMESFDNFKNEQIEFMLRKCYLKDLLEIIRKKNKCVFLIDDENTFKNIQEMVGRRNVHIHNNGIVDNMYATKYNIYEKEQNDYLEIDEKYLRNSIRITKGIVNNLLKEFEL